MTTLPAAKPVWILASSSPRRNEILSSLGLRFRIDPSHVPEPGIRRTEAPAAYAVRVALMKAREVRKRHTSGLVIGADTIVVAGGRIMGKPLSAEDARDMLHLLSGRWHEVITGVCLWDCASSRSRSGYARSRVHFRKISAKEIDWYMRTGEYRDKAGAYAIQGYASLFVDEIRGCYFNIVGFPVSTFERLCRSLGVNLIEEIKPQKRNGKPR